MKPDWKDAPEWANWLAQDHNGEWYWYEFQPNYYNSRWYPTKGRVRKVNITDWEYSLEERPK